MCNNKEQLLQQISAYQFAENEWALYLDTHPCDKNALRIHEKIAKTEKELIREYEHEYGPLDHMNSHDYNNWDWIEGKWPWEGI